MKKNLAKKLSLATETLRSLEEPTTLAKAVAGVKAYSDVVDTLCCSGGGGC